MPSKNPWQDKSNATVSIGLAIYKDPSSASVVVVKIAPQIPSSSLSTPPIPLVPCGNGSPVHKRHVETIVEFCPFGIFTEVSLANIITGLIIEKIVSLDRNSDLKHSSSPSLIISTIDYCKRGILNSDIVEGPFNCLGGGNAKKRESLIASLIALEGVAIITGESACPVGFVARPDVGLESKTFLDRLDAELVDVRNPTIGHSISQAKQEQHSKCHLYFSHKLI